MKSKGKSRGNQGLQLRTAGPSLKHPTLRLRTALCSMGTSLAPSPMASVMADSDSFTNLQVSKSASQQASKPRQTHNTVANLKLQKRCKQAKRSG